MLTHLISAGYFLLLSIKVTAFSNNIFGTSNSQWTFRRDPTRLRMLATDENTQSSSSNQNESSKAMDFLRDKGLVGRAKQFDFKNAMGVDEGSAKMGGYKNKPVKKSIGAYNVCTKSGVIDDFTENFPFTSSGSQWTGVTDRIMGGGSSGSLTRETIEGKSANVLRGKVSLANNGGFIQMATSLALDPGVSNTVDASEYDGVAIDFYWDGEEETQSFNVHFRNEDCMRQFSAYRSTFNVNKGEWCTVRLPWSAFEGYGTGAEGVAFDPSTLRRLGIVAIGKEMDVCLAVSRVSLYSVI